jgi:hypothetical protein
MAGKPKATIVDYWDIIIPKDGRFQELGTYETWIKYISDHHKLVRDIRASLPALDNQQNIPDFLDDAFALANQCKRFYDFFQKVLVADSFFIDNAAFIQRLGGMPNECRPSYNVDDGEVYNLESVLSTTTQDLLKIINKHLYRDQEQPQGMSPRQSIEDYLTKHPIDSQQENQIRQILQIAAKLKVEG